MSVDAIFTPHELAKVLVWSSRRVSPNLIADFCAGDGELLRAALIRWPEAKFIATDLTLKPLRLLKNKKPRQVGKCDFLNDKSRRACGALQLALSKVDLVLLNPPFSYRGAKTITVRADEAGLACSPAVAFVINCVPYLSPGGEIVAILPAGCVRSEKNEAAWIWLEQRFKISITATNNRTTFNGFFPSTVIIRFQMRPSTIRRRIARGTEEKKQDRPLLKVLRGSIPMHVYNALKKNGRVPFVHTTELQAHGADLGARVVNLSSSSVTGQFVVLPRVGQPSVGKLARLSANKVAFSDCILGVECGSVEVAAELFSLLQSRWDDVARLYQGTGAPYVTVSDFAQLLRDSGYPVESYHNGTSSGLFKKALAKESSRRSALLSAVPILKG